ncbi:PqqD family protein [Rivularia sp. UHCC 0363]|uniref:PqqD family protein n=1 Tax=Rivularia sp. UHCC 0363 TaxID=3110244 RepID=UPI002B1FC4B5|nr:PqqD family protein [Rivularia sp. UHCC 0363]MEA5593392.1 PqqD family protein [Rivularia sp. UHCC 0363]
MNQVTSILNQKLSIPENVFAQEVNGEVVILNIDSESYYTLNPVGSKVWLLLTAKEKVETVMKQLSEIYLVDDFKLRQDITVLVKELIEEGLLTAAVLKKHKILTAADEIKKFNQPERQKPENLDNRLLYEPPLLRKHGKVNDATNSTYLAPANFDGFFDFSDLS